MLLAWSKESFETIIQIGCFIVIPNSHIMEKIPFHMMPTTLPMEIPAFLSESVHLTRLTNKSRLV